MYLITTFNKQIFKIFYWNGDDSPTSSELYMNNIDDCPIDIYEGVEHMKKEFLKLLIFPLVNGY